MPDPHRPSPPSGFAPDAVLGEGSSAVVWLATHVSTGQRVALKVWRQELSDPAQRERFLTESQWLSRLAGEPHIVEQVWASDVADPHPWIATKAAGVSLPAWLREHPRTPTEQRLRIAEGILDGLAALHRRGLVHRDLNPNNVLVDEDGTVRLCDLGLVLEVGRRTVDASAGTPGFVAPELEELREEPGFTTDVYSAARVIDDLLGPDVSPEVEHLISVRAQSHRPADRPPDATRFRRELAALVPSEPADEPVDEAPRSGPRRHLSGRLLATTVVAAVIAVTVLVIAVLNRPTDPANQAAPPPTTAAATPTPATTPFPGESVFRTNTEHPAVGQLDQALIRHGCTRNHDGDGYQASDHFTEYTRLNVRDFQLANDELAGDPDGYPGPKTWELLFSGRAASCT